MEGARYPDGVMLKSAERRMKARAYAATSWPASFVVRGAYNLNLCKGIQRHPKAKQHKNRPKRMQYEHGCGIVTVTAF